MPDPRRLPYPMMRSRDAGPRRILGSFTPFGSSDWVFRRLRLDVKLIVFFCMRRGHLGGYQSCSSPQCEAAVGESGIITIDRRYGQWIGKALVPASSLTRQKHSIDSVPNLGRVRTSPSPMKLNTENLRTIVGQSCALWWNLCI